jgi:hypothetical protein
MRARWGGIGGFGRLAAQACPTDSEAPLPPPGRCLPLAVTERRARTRSGRSSGLGDGDCSIPFAARSLLRGIITRRGERTEKGTGTNYGAACPTDSQAPSRGSQRGVCESSRAHLFQHGNARNRNARNRVTTNASTSASRILLTSCSCIACQELEGRTVYETERTSEARHRKDVKMMATHAQKHIDALRSTTAMPDGLKAWRVMHWCRACRTDSAGKGAPGGASQFVPSTRPRSPPRSPPSRSLRTSAHSPVLHCVHCCWLGETRCA